MTQREVVAREVYADLEPDNPGLRTKEIERKTYQDIGTALASRLASIKSDLGKFDHDTWEKEFVSKCKARHSEMEQVWKNEWVKRCSGKRLIDDIYREYTIKLQKFDFKRKIAKRMLADQTEDWTLVKSKIRDALGT